MTARADDVRRAGREYSCPFGSSGVAMKASGEVSVERGGKTYRAEYSVEHGMVQVRTHTETRSVELGGDTPEAIARRVLDEIVDANRPG